jgi:cytochrome c-type biogenesis protein
MDATAPLTLGLAFLGGVLTVLSPCILPVVPLILGRALHSHRVGPLVLVLGLVSGFATAGSLLGFTSHWLSGFANLLRGFAIAALLLLGLLAMVPTWSYRLSRYWQLGQYWQVKRIGLWGEFWIGTQLGILWTPCAGPVLGSILVLAAVKQQVFASFVLLGIYGLGAGLPLLMIAYAGRSVSQSIVQLRSSSEQIQRIGGVIVVCSAIAILLGWDIQLQLWLAPLFPSIQL